MTGQEETMSVAKWGAVFDLDGLLVDSEPLQARSFNQVFEAYGFHLSEADFEALVGFETIDNFRHLRRKFAIETPLADLMARKEAAYHALVRQEMAPCRGAVTLVEALAAHGVPLAVASSSPRVDVRLSLETIGLSRFFPVVVTANDVPATKPAPDLYLRACQGIGLAPARCVAFEDSGTGLQAAVAAGLRCFVVPHKYTRNHDFASAEAVLKSLAEVSVPDLEGLFVH
jgi:HAD superfamily hydrolase (TIGR01509 family)